MRKTFCTAVLALAIAAGGSVLLGGTASAGVAPVLSADNCYSYKLVRVNGQWKLVKTATSCSSDSSNGGSTSGSTTSGGTSTNGQPGTTVNNCSPSSNCTSSAPGGTGTNY